MITVFADQYLYEIDSFLPESVDLRLYDPAQGLPKNLHKAHALLIRTVNAITPQTLPEIPEKLTFIGTGSAGTDHVDQSYLKEQGITFANAAGCNARSVAEYVITSLLLWAEKETESLQDLSVGIIGVGEVGTQVEQQLEKLQMSTICYDPPREERESPFRSSSLEEVLSADILTFHTPLVSDGNWPTYHWLNEKKLSSRQFRLIINTARGGVIDEQSLLQSHQNKNVSNFILDVWEDEPDLRPSTAEEAFFKTPHIAGYSIQAKQNASKFIADPLIEHFDLSTAPSKGQTEGQTIEGTVDNFGSLGELLHQLHPLKKYEARLQHILNNHRDQRGELFNKLRAEFPLRNEFSHIQLPASYFDRFPVLTDLGFGLIGQSE
ncbi:4-phosphoerythronate dehydrogenase [Fodinibius salsisoli]|uniref:4-phosphoerythronate dehydrogenase n=1 Tax=Fodinibius salsisoli TaxID=2820877 RepID=A0ABT3PPG9_9BACT|nr:4-phosphoerythronate dehydrogenase [Fodinibius salsisoli]MCW9707746.1 4-phosphoerythronate dehydrogenase [Fodinibius salsisoli]